MNTLPEIPKASNFKRPSGIELQIQGATTSEVVDILELERPYTYMRENESALVGKYGEAIYGEKLKQILWKSHEEISFDDFFRYPHITRNFLGFFGDSDLAKEKRKTDLYKNWSSLLTHRKNAKIISDALRPSVVSGEGPRPRIINMSDQIPYAEKFVIYLAYQTMLDYAHTNYDIFQ